LFLLWFSLFSLFATFLVWEQIRIAFAEEIAGIDSSMSIIFIVSWGGLVAVSLVYSVLLSQMHTSIRDITSYAARLRLDLNEIQGTLARIKTQEGIQSLKTDTPARLDGEQHEGSPVM
jgi:hypothetical protein